MKDGVFNDIGFSSFDKRKEKANIYNKYNKYKYNKNKYNIIKQNIIKYNKKINLRDKYQTAINAINIRVSFKRTAGDISLNEGGKRIFKSKKV